MMQFIEQNWQTPEQEAHTEQVPLDMYCLMILSQEFSKLKIGEWSQEQFDKTLDWARSIVGNGADNRLADMERLEKLKNKNNRRGRN